MLPRHSTTIPGRLNIQMKKSDAHVMTSGGRRHRLILRLVLCSSLILAVFLSVSFFASTSASHRDVSVMLNGAAGRLATTPPAMFPDEMVETFATDCATPKSVYVLGDTVCARVNGAPLPFFGFRQRRFQWVAPDGHVVQQTEITADPQDDSFVIPNSGQLAQVGTWGVRIVRNNGSTNALTRFIVRDPANLKADLSMGKFGQLNVKSGNNATYIVTIENRGPDAAQNVSFADDVPANMTFVSATQSDGPTFNCSNPSSGGTGTSTCTIATLLRDEMATFTFIYQVDTGTPVGTTIENTVSATSSTAELDSADNSVTVPVSVTGVGSGGNDCFIACPTDITVVAGTNQSGANVSYPDPTVTGSSCGAVSCSHGSGTFFPIGTTTVVCAAETGDPCSFNITVEDNQNPTISCPLDISTSEDTPGSGSATVTFPAPSASDNSGFVSVSCDHASPSSFPSGTTTVTCTATDGSGNSASCSFTVTVSGNGCVLSCPSNIVVDADAGSCGAVVTYPDPSATTECGTVTSTPASGSTFPVGTTTVVVSSSSGQNCSFTITVRDNQDPTITSCPGDITVNAPSGSCSATVNPGTATATDNCSGVTVVGKRSDFIPITDLHYPVGSTVVTWTATDGAGNSTSCHQIITVRDLIPPTVSINVPPSVANVNADANCQAIIPDISEFVTASDNCTPASGLTITQSPIAGTVLGNGPHTITIIVIEGDPDGPHNSTTGTTTFTVHDVTPPVITLNGANPIVVECHTSFTDPGATAHDTCAGDFAATASGTVNVNVPGSYTLTYNASDPSGNPAAAVTRTVNVVDTTPPTISCQSDMLVEFNPAVGGAVVTYTPPVGSDTCAGTLTATQLTGLPSGATFPLGITTNTFRVTDGAGLTATCSFNVTVALTSIIGLDSVTISGAGPIDSYDSNGSYPASKSSLANVVSNGTITMTGSAKVWGNVLSTRAGVAMSGASQVTGNATAGTTVSRTGSASVGGTITNNALAPVMVMPAVSVCGPPYSSASGISGTYSYNASTGDLTLSGVNIATLANGNYCFHNVTLGNSAQLKVNGPVTIKLTGTLNPSGSSSINNTTLIPSNLRILSSYTGSNGVNFTNSASAYLIVYAPGTNVTISGAAPLFGTVVGKTLTVSNSGMLHYDVRLLNIWPSLWPLIIGP